MKRPFAHIRSKCLRDKVEKGAKTVRRIYLQTIINVNVHSQYNKQRRGAAAVSAYEERKSSDFSM